MNKPASMATNNTTPRCAKDQTRSLNCARSSTPAPDCCIAASLLSRTCGFKARIPQAENEGKTASGPEGRRCGCASRGAQGGGAKALATRRLRTLTLPTPQRVSDAICVEAEDF